MRSGTPLNLSQLNYWLRSDTVVGMPITTTRYGLSQDQFGGSAVQFNQRDRFIFEVWSPTEAVIDEAIQLSDSTALISYYTSSFISFFFGSNFLHEIRNKICMPFLPNWDEYFTRNRPIPFGIGVWKRIFHF